MSEKITRADMEQAGLSEEEIAAYLDDEAAQAEEAGKSETGDPKLNEDGSPTLESADDELDAAAEAREAAKGKTQEALEADEAAAAAAEAAKADDTPAETKVFQPRMAVPEAKDYKALRTALANKFGEGEISNEEYTEQLAQLVSEETTARVAERFNSEQAANRWEWDQDRFFEDNPAYKSNKGRYAAMDAYVKEIAPKAVKEGWSGARVLNEAKKLVDADFGITAAAPSKPAVDPAKPRAKPNLRAVPVTLADVPNAGTDGIEGDDKFAAIDRMTGIEQEQAIASMSPAEYDQFLKYGAAA